MRFSFLPYIHRLSALQPKELARPAASPARLFISLCLAFVSIIALAVVLRTTEIFLTQKLIEQSQAATLPEYSARMITNSGLSISMKPGEDAIFSATFKNTGTATWKNQGARFLSIYTMDPKYRASSFYDSSWRLPEQPTVMKDPSVPPDTTGTFAFRLKAPKTPGTYKETFQLAAEEWAWVTDGKITITITVTGGTVAAPVPAPIVSPQPASSIPTSSSFEGYSASILLKSYRGEIVLDPNTTSTITLGIKNSGTKTWQSQSLNNSAVAIATSAPSASFRHLSWGGTDEAVREIRQVKPGELAFFTFTIQAPNKKGSYNPRFTLTTDNVIVPGGEIDIPVTVTADGPASNESAPAPAAIMIPEPMLRVGLFTTDKPITILANGDYEIYDGSGRLAETISGGQPTKLTFDFNYRTSTIITPTGTNVLAGYVRFVTKDPNGVFTIPSYEHRTGWNASLNDNMFRRTLEIHFVPATNNLWIINELPMEFYLRGLAETSNYSPAEFQKALITAARSYAFYHFQRNTKHGGHFHVDATYDQVYRGYGNEIRTPTLTAAVEATRGSIVTYNGDPVITPYYSRSDGRTRDWTEVWGGTAKPWLVSVPAPYDAGKTLWGHGVGMAASDAVGMANNNYLWDAIVKHYYTGIELKQYWK